MQIGCHFPTTGPVATREALLYRKAEEQQIASLCVSDHIVCPKVNTSNYPCGLRRLSRRYHPADA
jgi:hypothetical protein